MAEKRNIFLIGPMGAGKSTIGRHLAEQLHMEFFDSDHEIERRSGADIGWVFDVEGEEGFRIREEKVIGDSPNSRGIVLATVAVPSRAVKPATNSLHAASWSTSKPPLKSNWREPRETSVVPCCKPKSRPWGCWSVLRSSATPV